MGKKRKNWQAMEPDWAAGQLSKAEIGRKFEVSVAAMNKHFKNDGLIYGSLSSSVRLKIDAKLVEQPGEDKVSGKVSVAEPGDVVNQAAEVGASIVRSHRKDIVKQFIIKAKSETLLLSVETPTIEDGKKLSLDELQSVKLFVDIADRLAQTTERLIKLQRQAFSLDDPGNKPGNGEITEIARVIIDASCTNEA
jgi:hypothetical protein